MKVTNRQAIEAQQSINTILRADLPMKTKLEIAVVSNSLDDAISMFYKLRDLLLEQYKIKVKATDNPNRVSFESKSDSSEDAIRQFKSKMDELLAEDTAIDIRGTIHLTEDSQISLELLKPLANFIEIQ